MPPVKIVLTGPESTGKSTLAYQLAHHFNGILIEEFAREYIANLNRPYQYSDVEIIARKQINDLKSVENRSGIVVLDTFLIITKVWFEVVFKSCPGWIEDAILDSHIDMFLLCAPDLPWVSDNVRENGGPMREWLFNEYEANLKKYNLNYKIVTGFDGVRISNAITEVESYLATIT